MRKAFVIADQIRESTVGTAAMCPLYQDIAGLPPSNPYGAKTRLPRRFHGWKLSKGLLCIELLTFSIA
ncbi:hypothetical protein KAH81_09830 [bacterium]|nr:hypothetical protein [bacterium]